VLRSCELWHALGVTVGLGREEGGRGEGGERGGRRKGRRKDEKERERESGWVGGGGSLISKPAVHSSLDEFSESTRGACVGFQKLIQTALPDQTKHTTGASQEPRAPMDCDGAHMGHGGAQQAKACAGHRRRRVRGARRVAVA
jgi:hypothetical protein